MKTWIYIAVAALGLMLAGNVFAIERKEGTPKATKVEEPKDKGEPQKAAPNNLTEPKRKTKQRPAGYDDFVDKNNNGIDDRAEVKKEKVSTEKKKLPSSESKKKGEKK